MLGGLAFVVLAVSNALVVRYEVDKSEARITQAIATESAKLRAWETAQSEKPRSESVHARCYLSGTGQWPEEATTSDCTEDYRPNATP
jgi:hypothetical protein